MRNMILLALTLAALILVAGILLLGQYVNVLLSAYLH